MVSGGRSRLNRCVQESSTVRVESDGAPYPTRRAGIPADIRQTRAHIAAAPATNAREWVRVRVVRSMPVGSHGSEPHPADRVLRSRPAQPPPNLLLRDCAMSPRNQINRCSCRRCRRGMLNTLSTGFQAHSLPFPLTLSKVGAVLARAANVSFRLRLGSRRRRPRRHWGRRPCL